MSVLVNGTLVLGCSGGNRQAPPSNPDGGSRFLVKWEHEGRVGTVDAESFTLNMCDADSDCLDARATVRIAAADLDLQTVLEPGALVKVHGETDTWVCSGYLVAESLDSWNGMTNPVPAAGGFYVAAFEAAAWATAPYRIGPVRLPCPFDTTLETCGGTDLSTGLYVFEFKPSRENTPTTLVPMGQTVSVAVPHLPARWRVRNLRSFQTSYCDDYWNWAYWIARER